MRVDIVLNLLYKYFKGSQQEVTIIKIWLALGFGSEACYHHGYLPSYDLNEFSPLSLRRLSQIRHIVGQYCEVIGSTFMLQDPGKGAESAWNRACFQILGVKFPASMSTAHACDTSSRGSDLALATRGQTNRHKHKNFSLEGRFIGSRLRILHKSPVAI